MYFIRYPFNDVETSVGARKHVCGGGRVSDRGNVLGAGSGFGIWTVANISRRADNAQPVDEQRCWAVDAFQETLEIELNGTAERVRAQTHKYTGHA